MPSLFAINFNLNPSFVINAINIFSWYSWQFDQHSVNTIKQQKRGWMEAHILDLLKERSAHGQMVESLTKVKIQPGF